MGSCKLYLHAENFAQVLILLYSGMDVLVNRIFKQKRLLHFLNIDSMTLFNNNNKLFPEYWLEKKKLALLHLEVNALNTPGEHF